MSQLAQEIAAGYEPIPGYVLIRKIGVGGYGEVWLADAPGGLKKAVKFVHGSVDEERAGGELRALEQIREVNHPFVLSLERFEIVDKRLVVITELADGSLLDRYREMFNRSLGGIPRGQLLRYLSDAADALDYLYRYHTMQHLDVKPGNLLLLADRIKLADFGLIKSLERANEVGVAGLTPTYAAPEMFDGRPSRSSDQYSLAIVYQEMLTGELPFSGRTTAQLAIQHTQKAPNLQALPVLDRPIIARALSKKASQRFNSCREFIDALTAVERGESPTTHQSFTGSARSVSAVDVAVRATEPTVGLTTPRAPGTAGGDEILTEGSLDGGGDRTIEKPPVRRREDRPRLITALSLPEASGSKGSAAVDTAGRPAMLIGCGQTGVATLMQLRQRLIDEGRTDIFERTRWLAIDTDGKTLEWSRALPTAVALSDRETLHLPLGDPQYYRQQDRDRFQPVSRRWLFNIPRSRQTEGVRPLAMLALLDHARTVDERIRGELDKTVTASMPGSGRAFESLPAIYLAGSLHGATGSCLVGELGMMTRRLCSELRDRQPGLTAETIVAVVTAAAGPRGQNELQSATAATALCELRQLVESRGLHPGLPGLPALPVSAPPLDACYLAGGGQLGSGEDWQRGIEAAAHHLYCELATPLGPCLAQGRQNNNAGQNAQEDDLRWLRTSTAATLVRQEASPDLATTLPNFWLSEVLHSFQHGLCPSQSGQSRPRRSEHAVDMFCADVMGSCGWQAGQWIKSCFRDVLDSRGGLVCPLGATGDIDQLSDDLDYTQAVHRINTLVMAEQHDCRWIVQRWMNDGMTRFVASLSEHWCKHGGNWSALPVVMERLSGSLLQQAEILFELTHGGARTAVEGRSETAMQLKADVHRLAGYTLQRIAHLVSVCRQRWLVEAKVCSQQFALWRSKLAQSIGKFDASRVGRGDDASPLMQVRSDVRVRLMAAVIDHLRNRLIQSLKPAVGTVAFGDQSSVLHDSNKQLNLWIDLASAAYKTAAEAHTYNAHIGGDEAGRSIELQLNRVHDGSLARLGVSRAAILCQSNEAAQMKEVTAGMREQLAIVPWIDCREPMLFLESHSIALDDLLQQMWPLRRSDDALQRQLSSRIDIDWRS